MSDAARRRRATVSGLVPTTVCTALGVEVSGSIGVLVVSVENGELTANEAKEALAAMDEVGARPTASLLRRAEASIDEASGAD